MSEETNPMAASIDDETAAAIREKLQDAETPGYQAEFDPVEAEYVGAFVEDALSEEDALASTEDLADEKGAVPTFLDDDGPSADIPTVITTANANQLFGLRKGETLAEALVRFNAEGGA